ncbi:MAG: NAD(P)H-hydrate epimerase [Anaerovoracaceae bacterium]
MKVFGEHFVTCGQMKILEKRADERGLSYYQMMENAGTAAARIIMETVSYRKALKPERNYITNAALDWPAKDVKQMDSYEDSVRIAEKGANIETGSESDKKSRVLVFCGKGNNGGDGFVSARLLKNSGWDVDVVLADGGPRTRDSIRNFDILKSMDINIIDMNVDDRALMDANIIHDVIIDAVYGTGFHGNIANSGLKCTAYINRKHDNTLVFALDIPSGLGGDLIEADGIDKNSVKADYTIAFHAKKPVHLQKFSEEYCGKVIVADIGIDEEKLMDVDNLLD